MPGKELGGKSESEFGRDGRGEKATAEREGERHQRRDGDEGRGREGGREGQREGGMEGGREGGREGQRDGWMEGGREGEREKGREQGTGRDEGVRE